MADNELKSFTCHIPVDLVKADVSYDSVSEDELDSWKIQGIASTGDLDLQGEMVIQDGLDISVLKAGRGLFNADHNNNPENILGQIEDADFVKCDGSKALMVKGYLFKHQPRAQAYYNILKSLKKGAQSRVHFSIEGKILQRDPADVSTIRKAKITKVALTLDPVNPSTFVSLVKSLSSIDESLELEKAMEAGAGHTKAPTERTGGEALATESLDSKPKSTCCNKEALCKKCMGAQKMKKSKKLAEQVIKSTIVALSSAHPDADPVEVAKLVCKSFENKIMELV